MEAATMGGKTPERREPDDRRSATGDQPRLTLRGEFKGYLILYIVFAMFAGLLAGQCVHPDVSREAPPLKHPAPR